VEEDVEFLGIEVLVTLFKKIRPFRNSGVFFFFVCPDPPGNDKGLGTDCFLSRELLFPTFLPFGGTGNASLQQRMIFSNRKT
jgi:hypothetical protein